MFAFRQVLTFCGARLVEPDVACSSVNFKGLPVQEGAFNSQTFEPVKVTPSSFKGAESTRSSGRREAGGPPRTLSGPGEESQLQGFFPLCSPRSTENALELPILHSRNEVKLGKKSHTNNNYAICSFFKKMHPKPERFFNPSTAFQRRTARNCKTPWKVSHSLHDVKDLLPDDQRCLEGHRTAFGLRSPQKQFPSCPSSPTPPCTGHLLTP